MASCVSSAACLRRRIVADRRRGRYDPRHVADPNVIMFIRLAVPGVAPLHTGHACGVFTAWYALKDSGRVPPHQYEPLRQAIEWFNAHLPIPQRAARIPVDAIFWFRADQPEMTRRLWTVVTGLRLCECEVHLLRTPWPGRIAYRDQYQVAARILTRRTAARTRRLPPLRLNG